MVSCLNQEKTFPKDIETHKTRADPKSSETQKKQSKLDVQSQTGEGKMQRPISDENKIHFF